MFRTIIVDWKTLCSTIYPQPFAVCQHDNYTIAAPVAQQVLQFSWCSLGALVLVSPEILPFH